MHQPSMLFRLETMVDPVLQRQVDEFRAKRELEGLRLDEVFETFTTFCVVSRLREAHFDPDALRTGGTGDQGIDGFALLINGELCTDPSQVTDALELGYAPRIQFVVVQAKTTAEFVGKVFSDLSDAIEHVFGAAELRADCSPKIRHVRRLVDRVFDEKRLLVGNLPELYVYYATPGKPPRRIDPKRQEAEQRLSKRTDLFRAVRVEALGGSELRDLYKRATEALSATLPIPRQRRAELPPTPGITKGLLGTIAARDLVENLLRDESKAMRRVLFDENVRDFQGLSGNVGNVNATMHETLRDADVRQRFVVLNNGITIVAPRVEMIKDSVVVVDPRIVNGCQTSNVLFDAHDQEPLDDHVMLPVRILETSDPEVIESIVISTNRQTAINMNSLVVRGELHREIEQYFEAQIPARRLYYERRPGQYRRRDVIQTRVITRIDLARAYAATFLGDSSRLWQNDLTPQRAQEIFDPATDPLLFYIAASVHFRLEWLLKTRTETLAELRPARYVIMRAIAIRLVGPTGLPPGRVERKAICRNMLETIWGDGLESVVGGLIPAVWAEANRVTAAGGDLARAARTQEFGDRVCVLVLRPT